MIIYPAIDLRGGQVVRLREGKPERETVFSNDPIATAQRWIEQGAKWIHMVNLDGAFSNANDNGSILEAIAKLDIQIQFGGGLRSLEDMEQAIDSGANRIVFGTVAIENPDIIDRALAKFGAERICVALDAREGKITTHGWTNTSELTPQEFGRLIADKGVRHALYTDVKRDGSLIGSNTHDTIALGRSTGLKVIASGGVSTADEIYQLARSKAVAGAVIGMALYEDKLTLKEALFAAEKGNAS